LPQPKPEACAASYAPCVLKSALIRPISPVIPGGCGDAVYAPKPLSLLCRFGTPEPVAALQLERYPRPALGVSLHTRSSESGPLITSHLRRLTMQLTIGADVAKSSFDIALPLENGNYRTRRKICNTPAGWEQLLAWHKKYAPEAAVGMEATGIYHEGLANALFAAGVRVYVVNPTQIKAYGRSELLRTKTDHTDAQLIARFFQARTKALPAYVPLPPSQRTLRSLVRRLDDLNGMQRMELNRLESADAVVRDGLQAVIDTLRQLIRTVKGAITRHINSHPDLRQRRDLLTTIPGIGSATSATLMACLGDLSQ